MIGVRYRDQTSKQFLFLVCVQMNRRGFDDLKAPVTGGRVLDLDCGAHMINHHLNKAPSAHS